MRRRHGLVGLVAAVAAVGVVGCGGSGGSGTAVITGQSLGDALAVAAQDRYDAEGQFGTQVGDQGGSCQGGGARWSCRLDIVLRDTIHDVRTYDVTVDRKGCWLARQTATDVGVTGRPSRPANPDVLRGCVK